MKLSQLGFFCAVVERGTIAAAAEQLHCVPSNITTRLRELEGQLGVALFNRERNRLLVTPEGRLLYRHARRLLALADETAALFAGDQAHGALRVGALDVALANHLPQRLARYRRESPGVELHIRPEHSLLLERLLMEGELDLIVTDGPIEHPLLASRLAFRERLLRVTPADLPAPTPEDLASLELYVFGHTCHYRRQVDRWLAESGIQPEPLRLHRGRSRLRLRTGELRCTQALHATGFPCRTGSRPGLQRYPFRLAQTASLAADPGLHRQHRRRLTPTNDAATQTHSEKSVTAEPLHRPEKKPPPTRPGGDTGSTLGGRLPSRSPTCPLGFPTKDLDSWEVGSSPLDTPQPCVRAPCPSALARFAHRAITYDCDRQNAPAIEMALPRQP